MRHLRLGLGALVLLVAACSGGDDASGETSAAGADPVAEDLAASESAAAAATNIPELEASGDVLAVEVLDVADGSVTTLRDAVTGDRPVLVWFWAPH